MPTQCPGQSRRFWTARDIADSSCPSCGAAIELWKDDIKRTCRACGAAVVNPRIADTCLAWCDKAAECLGGADIEEWKKRNPETKRAR